MGCALVALIRLFRGKPVKHMERVGDRIKLIFYAPIPGKPGRQEMVSQQDWDEHGEKRTVTAEEATGDALRRLAGP